MSLIQLEYIVAIDTYRSFVTAAEKCFVTQPTLSMQVQKLEEVLGVKLFDRSRHPITPTEIGSEIIAQARIVLQENGRIRELISNQQQEISGELKIGIIPTIAPYLLPEVISAMLAEYPQLKLLIWENTTEEIIQQLKRGVLDCGILATPLSDDQIKEVPLYYEIFAGYVSKGSSLYKRKTIDAGDLQEENLWLLDEGHCMRSQVLSICQNRGNLRKMGLEYNTGSVETLIRMVDLNQGATLLPELAISSLSKKQLNKVRYFKSPQPVREISLVVNNNFIKNRTLNALREQILNLVPKSMRLKKSRVVLRPD